MELGACASEYVSGGIFRHRIEKGKLILNAGISLGRQGLWLYQNTENMWTIKSRHTVPFLMSLMVKLYFLSLCRKLHHWLSRELPGLWPQTVVVPFIGLSYPEGS